MSDNLHLRTRYREPAGPTTILMLLLWLFFTVISYLLGGFNVILPESLRQNVSVSYLALISLVFGLTAFVFLFVRYDRNRRRILLLPTLAAMAYPVVMLGGIISENLSRIPFVH